MEEKKDRTTEGNIPQQGEDLSEQDKEILAEIDREDMDEMDRKAQDALGADEWIHVDFTLDYDTALEGLKLAARMLLESQRSLQTVAFGIVIITFIWPAISSWRWKPLPSRKSAWALQEIGVMAQATPLPWRIRL